MKAPGCGDLQLQSFVEERRKSAALGLGGLATFACTQMRTDNVDLNEWTKYATF